MVRKELPITSRFLKDAKEKAGITLPVLAERAGIAQASVCRILGGKAYVSLTHVLKLAAALKAEEAEVIAAWKRDKINQIDAEIRAVTGKNG